MKIYTKVGDGGDTFLFGGEKVRKDHPRVMACGDIDELNTVLGAAVGLANDREIIFVLTKLQNDLFVLGADLATPPSAQKLASTPRIASRHVAALEKTIDRVSARLSPLTHFILPGGCALGATLHGARAVCRRAERALVPLVEDNTAAQIYLNRLSDLLFVLARYANLKADKPETAWFPHKTGVKRVLKSRLPNPK